MVASKDEGKRCTHSFSWRGGRKAAPILAGKENMGSYEEHKKRIENINLECIHPYSNNAKIHGEKQIQQIMESIRKFGFINPILIDESKTVIAGHGRLEAAKRLKIQSVPCVYVEGLSEEQKRAYILADNKLAEMSTWNRAILKKEIAALPKFDMTKLGFNPPKSVNPGSYYGDYRENTGRQYNLDFFDKGRAEGIFQMPILEPTDYVPEDLQGFNYILNKPDYKKGVHFFIDDYQFERIWREPERYIKMLKKFPCVLTPDFSLYMDMPIAMKIWNIYRSRLIGQMMQDEGITVIPTLSWAEPETYNFCFDGLEKSGTVAVSTVGCMRSKEAKSTWSDGIAEALKRLRPKTVICYGQTIDYCFGKTSVKYIDARDGWG